MNILLTLEKGHTRDIYFPAAAIESLQKLGNVRFNDTFNAFTEEEMKENIKDIDICVTHWGCPKFTKEVVESAGRLKLIAHAAGSVAYMVTDHVYEKGIKVSTANSIMAKYVAEAALTYILSGLRKVAFYDNNLKSQGIWENSVQDISTLFEQNLGLIGLGTVGTHLLELLKPFDVNIRLYDPYAPKDILTRYPNIELCSMEEVISWANVVSVHASLTPETYHMINAERLKLLKDGALLVNTARGAVIDEKALAVELAAGRIYAVLDVYEEEPLPLSSPLRTLQNVTLIPHMAGGPSKEKMTFAAIDEVERFLRNEPLRYEVQHERFKLMTREV